MIRQPDRIIRQEQKRQWLLRYLMFACAMLSETAGVHLIVIEDEA